MSKHVHRYRRINIGHGKPYWVMKCVKNGCSHYTAMASKLSCPILKDSVAECNRCEERFILDKRALRMAEPCCDDCVNKKTNPKVKEAEDFFTKLEASLPKL